MSKKRKPKNHIMPLIFKMNLKIKISDSLELVVPRSRQPPSSHKPARTLSHIASFKYWVNSI